MTPVFVITPSDVIGLAVFVFLLVLFVAAGISDWKWKRRREQNKKEGHK